MNTDRNGIILFPTAQLDAVYRWYNNKKGKPSSTYFISNPVKISNKIILFVSNKGISLSEQSACKSDKILVFSERFSYQLQEIFQREICILFGSIQIYYRIKELEPQ